MSDKIDFELFFDDKQIVSSLVDTIDGRKNKMPAILNTLMEICVLILMLVITLSEDEAKEEVKKLKKERSRDGLSALEKFSHTFKMKTSDFKSLDAEIRILKKEIEELKEELKNERK